MKILVAEDFDTMHKIIRDILNELGYNDIVAAYNGESAYKILCSQKIDLIISDWNMPKMTGLELLKQVRANPALADLPFIMVTAEVEKDRIIEAIKEKVDQYVIKPFNTVMLAEKIKFALQKRETSE